MPKRERELKNSSTHLLKVEGDKGIVEAVVSVFGVIDGGDDRIFPGAFTKTINERGNALRVKTLDSHNTGSTKDVIGKVLEIREISREMLPDKIKERFPEATGGLWTKTQYLLDTEEGLGTFKRIAAEAVNEYSIGYEALDFDFTTEISEDGRKVRVRNLRTIKLWEFSPVIWGMNPATATVSVKGSNGETETDATTKVRMAILGDYLHGWFARSQMNELSWLYTGGLIDTAQYNTLVEIFSKNLNEARAELPDELANMPMNDNSLALMSKHRETHSTIELSVSDESTEAIESINDDNQVGSDDSLPTEDVKNEDARIALRERIKNLDKSMEQ